MRVLIGGLLGLCLLASMPTESQARGDARAAVQPSRPAAQPPRAAAQPARAAAPRAAMIPARTASQPVRGAARQPVATTRGSARQLAAAPSRMPVFAQRGAARQPAFAQRGTAGRFAAPPARGRAFAAIPYGRPMAQAPSAYRQTALASCTVRAGRRLCTTGVTRSVAFRWGGELGSQSMAQSNCPDGTIATMAIGHSDVVRCVPL